jgi:diaminopimelate epimerase
LACGSGACAAAVIGVIKKELETPVKVNFELGSLLIDYKEESKMISATGKAEFLEKKEITI